MLNIEKYKNEVLKELNIRLNKKRRYGADLCLGEALFSVYKRENSDATATNIVEWLTQECKAPILTNKEKTYLKNVIEPQRHDIAYIEKSHKFYDRQEHEHFVISVYVKNPYNFNFPSPLLEFIVTKDMPFEGVELFKKYTLEELDL